LSFAVGKKKPDLLPEAGLPDDLVSPASVVARDRIWTARYLGCPWVLAQHIKPKGAAPPCPSTRPSDRVAPKIQW